jgi:diguanylate cyclase (GGDEF)-like protein
VNYRTAANSIVTRLILFGLVIAAITGVVRYYVLTNFLRDDLEKVVASQQEALAGYVAQDIDFKIRQRQKMLKDLAERVPLALLDRPAELQRWLRQYHEFQPLFSQGLFVTNTLGVATTDYPALPGRAGGNYIDRDYVRSALQGEMSIGRPVMGRAAREPIVPMAAPIKDSRGQVRAVLAGITATAAPGFFDLLQKVRIGNSGGFLLISPREHVIVAATKADLILKPTAAPGTNPLHDRALAGWRGSGITINAQGIEEVSAVASVDSAGWFVVARLPTVEAFATVSRTQNYILRNSVLVVSAFIIFLAIGLRLIFRPLARAARRADLMTSGELPLSPLPIERDDEVGHLTSAFNRLLEKLRSSQAQLAEIAHHDQLTGLPNRRLLSDRIGQTLARSHRNGTALAVLFLDLDGFKPINDQYGHEAGDEALIQVGRRLSMVVREVDTLARVGGDEFVIVISDLDPTAEKATAAASAVAAKCLEAISAPMTIKGEAQTVGASIGIALGDGNSSFDELLSMADNAMYKAKEAGKGKYVLAISPLAVVVPVVSTET